MSGAGELAERRLVVLHVRRECGLARSPRSPATSPTPVPRQGVRRQHGPRRYQGDSRRERPCRPPSSRRFRSAAGPSRRSPPGAPAGERRKGHPIAEIVNLLCLHPEILIRTHPVLVEAANRRQTLEHPQPHRRHVPDWIGTPKIRSGQGRRWFQPRARRARAQPGRGWWTPQTSPGQYPAGTPRSTRPSHRRQRVPLDVEPVLAKPAASPIRRIELRYYDPAIVASSPRLVAVTQNSATTRSPSTIGLPIRTLTVPCSACSLRR